MVAIKPRMQLRWPLLWPPIVLRLGAWETIPQAVTQVAVSDRLVFGIWHLLMLMLFHWLEEQLLLISRQAILLRIGLWLILLI